MMGKEPLVTIPQGQIGYVFARERIPQELSEAMLGLSSDATVFLLIVFALSMLLGTALDAIAESYSDYLA